MKGEAEGDGSDGPFLPGAACGTQAVCSRHPSLTDVITALEVSDWVAVSHCTAVH